VPAFVSKIAVKSITIIIIIIIIIVIGEHISKSPRLLPELENYHSNEKVPADPHISAPRGNGSDSIMIS